VLKIVADSKASRDITTYLEKNGYKYSSSKDSKYKLSGEESDGHSLEQAYERSNQRVHLITTDRGSAIGFIMRQQCTADMNFLSWNKAYYTGK